MLIVCIATITFAFVVSENSISCEENFMFYSYTVISALEVKIFIEIFSCFYIVFIVF